MKKGLTEIVFIIDRSGSMSGLEADTIGGYNSMLNKQKKLDGEALVSTVFFNHVSSVIHDRVPIDKVKEITEEDYFVCGCTALLDAVGQAIHHIGNIHKYAREEDVPEKTLFIITTDGMENASHNFGYSAVKTMIEKKKKDFGWEFLFLGANIDSAKVGARMGISSDFTVDYDNTSEGTQLNYMVLDKAITYARSCDAPIKKSWKDKIVESRKK